MCVVNSQVLDDLQLDRVTVPEGGAIERDADGPTGLVQERAQALEGLIR
jgi:predicted amidohydrolase YtcJ